ncbi:MAG TPA: flagellar hook-basal body protein [Thermomicrobiales bacterium]|nr:flagellar hook-basal body protein [Thermomicrobiales bacterium]
MSAYGISASGIRMQQYILDTIAHNMANMHTTGFKARRAEPADIRFDLHDILELQSGEDEPASAGVYFQATTTLWGQGAAQITDRDLDVAIFGEGFLRIDTGAGIAYTRNGALNIDANGTLVTDGGGYVLDVDGQPIQIPAAMTFARIDRAGNVFAVPVAGGAEQQVGQISLARFDSPDGLLAIGDSLFQETEASGAPVIGVSGAEGFGRVINGVLEMANLDLADEMTRMVEAQRAYQLNINALRTLDEMIARAFDMRR